jgi:hypothetical protein
MDAIGRAGGEFVSLTSTACCAEAIALSNNTTMDHRINRPSERVLTD